MVENLIKGHPEPDDDDDELSLEIKRLNNDIRGQNERYREVDTFRRLNAEALKATRTGIGDEQIDTLQELMEKARGIDFEGLAKESLKAHEELEQAQSEAAADDELRREIERAIELAPRKAAIISELGEEQHRKETGAKVAKLTQRAAETDRLLERYGRAWEIPQAVSPDDRMILFDMIHDSEFEVQDIIPITPEEKSSLIGVAERTKHTVEQPEATDYLVAYFVENPNKVITVEELIRLLYIADVKDTDYRSRVTTLLGPKVNGKQINNRLNEAGLGLQYGWRYLMERTHSSDVVRRRTRIYRSVIPQQAAGLDVRILTETAGLTVHDRIDPPKEVEAPVGGAASERDMEEAAIETDSVAPEIAEATWEDGFRQDVQEAIDMLIADHLFDDDEIQGRIIRSLSSSTKLGTETARGRLSAAGLMTSSQVKSDYMNREQRVMSVLFNNHPQLHHRKTGQRRARDIIREEIESKLKELDS